MGTTGQSITLANSIIGVGILAMPFCFQQCGLVLATLILLFMGLISRLCCYFLLKSALLARRRNFEFLAFHVFGPAGKMAVEVGIIGFLMGTCIAYFVVVGDLGPQIVAKMFNINQSDILRTSIMVIVSLVCVLPLGLLRNVDSLSNVSAATIGFYFCLVMKVILEAASQLMTSEWHRRVEMWRPAGLLQCVPIFSMALFCQTQLFEIFESLPSLSLEKMNVVTKNAINICTAVYFTLGVFGYIAFSSQDISGNILMSLSPTMANDVIKLGFVMSLAFSFPLIIFPCRASLYSFLYKKVHSSHHDHIINHSIPETTFRYITVAIIAVTLFISLLIPNIELVLGLVGSTIGVLICVVFPAKCFVNVTFKNTNERLLAKGVLVLGLIIMVLGTYANLEAAGENSNKVLHDEKYTREKIDKIVEDFFEKRDKDDLYPKPQKNDKLPIEQHTIELKNEIIKDSEVQPPNPVPPDSQPIEKITKTKPEEIKPVEQKLSPRIIKEIVDKASETHPRNLKTKLETKMNAISKPEPEKTKETKPQSNEDKIDIIKQQKLIETIKQHGEEQKELMKEQKEILDEIIKTKKELQQNKNEADTNEAKKIAVESIKQIANMAIQSIGGVSEKPDQVKDKQVDRLEKLTNEAVQEIAKKAVETIEAIQDIKENPEQPKIHANVQNVQQQIVNSVQNSQDIQAKEQNIIPQVNSQNEQQLNIKPRAVDPANIQPVAQNIQPQVVAQNVQPQAIKSQNAQPQAIVQQNAQPQAVPQNVPPQAVLSQNAQPQAIVQQNAQPQAIVQQNAQPQAVLSQNAQLQAIVQQNSQPQEIVQQNAQPQAVPQNVPPQEVLSLNAQPQAIVQQNAQPQAVPQNVPPQKIVQDVQPQIPKIKNLPILQANPPVVNSKVVQNILPNPNPPIPVPQKVETNAINQNIQETVQKQAPEIGKEHSHLPDEPSSYKRGEDTQGKIAQNVPLPLAMNDLLSNKQIQEKEAIAEQLNEDINNNQKVPERQKREVVDCTQKNTLEIKDKQICDTLVDRPKDNLPPVDMNEIALPKSLPMDVNILHHISRSLKSFEKDER